MTLASAPIYGGLPWALALAALILGGVYRCHRAEQGRPLDLAAPWITAWAIVAAQLKK